MSGDLWRIRLERVRRGRVIAGNLQEVPAWEHGDTDRLVLRTVIERMANELIVASRDALLDEDTEGVTRESPDPELVTTQAAPEHICRSDCLRVGYDEPAT